MIGFKSVGKFLIDCLSTLETARNEMQLTRHISLYNSLILRRPYVELFRSYFGLQQVDAELFRSYFRLQQADLNSALGETRA